MRAWRLTCSWLMFFSGWFAWTCDGYDFFAVSLTVSRLAKQFEVNTKVSVQGGFDRVPWKPPSVAWSDEFLAHHHGHHPYATVPIARRSIVRCARRPIRP